MSLSQIKISVFLVTFSPIVIQLNFFKKKDNNEIVTTLINYYCSSSNKSNESCSVSEKYFETG